MTDQETIALLEAKLVANKGVIEALTDRVKKLTGQLEDEKKERSFWQGHVMRLDRQPQPEMLCYTFTINPMLFFNLSQPRREQLWMDQVRRATLLLAESCFPKI